MRTLRSRAAAEAGVARVPAAEAAPALGGPLPPAATPRGAGGGGPGAAWKTTRPKECTISEVAVQPPEGAATRQIQQTLESSIAFFGLQ